jgi:hypothetical protein
MWEIIYTKQAVKDARKIEELHLKRNVFLECGHIMSKYVEM